MSVESIVERIRSEGTAEAENILANAKRKAEETENAAKAEAERLRQETQADVENRAAAIAAHFAASARLDVKKIMLAARKKAVENVYKNAEQRLIALEKEETLALFARLLETYAEQGDGVIFAKGFKFTEAVKLLPVFEEKQLKVLSEGEAAAILGSGIKLEGGLYLCGKIADKDLSFHALLKADREKYEAQIASELFGCDQIETNDKKVDKAAENGSKKEKNK